jgi:carbon monoxide dehydrogenase subunit G
MKLESKIGKIPSTDERIYNFLTDFNNVRNLIPPDKVKDWQSDENSCQFTIDPIGRTGVKIVEKTPYSLIKLTNLEESNFNFLFWVQLKPTEDNQTYMKLTMDVNLNPMLEAMAKKPLQEFLDKLIEQLARYPF